MARGPAPKPLAYHESTGNAAHKVLNTNEPKFPAASIEPPDWLAEDADALDHWQRLAPYYEQQGLLTVADIGSFIAWCVAYSIVIKAAKECLNTETFTNNKQGMATPIGEYNKAALLYNKHAEQFGGTPSSRTRVTVQRIKGASELEDLKQKLFG